MKHIVTVVDNKFLCELEEHLVNVFPLQKRQPLNDFLSDGAIGLIEWELEKLTGESYEIKA